MITKEQYLELEAKIRKDLPRLLEFREGLILKSKVSHRLYSDYIMIKTIWNDICTYVEIIEPKHKGNFSDNIDILLENFEIIGHDILLSDVLEWFSKLEHETIIVSQITTKGTLIGTENTDILRAVIFGKWDLSKPRLKDQSEELIGFLYNLINNN